MTREKASREKTSETGRPGTPNGVPRAPPHAPQEQPSQHFTRRRSRPQAVGLTQETAPLGMLFADNRLEVPCPVPPFASLSGRPDNDRGSPPHKKAGREAQRFFICSLCRLCPKRSRKKQGSTPYSRR